jgi:hypothetical protein
MNKQIMKSVNAAAELHLVRKPVQRVQTLECLREGSTGRIVVIPRVWAVAEAQVVPVTDMSPEAKPPLELAFYRKYTEALLRRYLRLSMQSGRVPSLLSKDLFRGHVTRYSVRGFEDVVIFCHDVERRLAKLNDTEREIVKRVVLQRYTLPETAGVMGVSLNNLRERYGTAIDRLTRMLLDAELLEPQKRG